MTRRAFDGKAAYRAFRGGCHRQDKLVESKELSIDHTECIGWIHLSYDVAIHSALCSTRLAGVKRSEREPLHRVGRGDGGARTTSG